MSMFQRASKKQAKLRAALLGPAGSGKTYSALKIGRALVGASGKIALMDTEHGSASKYADLFEFDTVAPTEFSVDTYIETIAAAGAAGYDLLIIDSLSHAWAGKGGLLEFVDNYAKRNSGNSFGAWRDATPKHNDLVEAMLACPCHLIVTMRVKMEHVVEKDDRGKTQIRKVGLQPVQRDGLEYEFDVVGDLTSDNDLSISKTRCSALRGKFYREPGEDIASVLRSWLSSGEAEAPKVPTFTPAKVAAPTAPLPPPRPATPEADHRNVPGGGAPSVPPSSAEAITSKQLSTIYVIGRNEHKFLDAETDEMCVSVFGVRPSELTKAQASQFITNMQNKARS